MTTRVKGSCQCGAVVFQITGAFEGFFLCHCSRCRKDTGSAHAANMFSSTATIEWLSGLDSIRTYRVTSTRHQKSFCVKCGSALPTASESMLVVPAGSLDTDIDIRPEAHIFFASRATWDEHLEDLPKFDRTPRASS